MYHAISDLPTGILTRYLSRAEPQPTNDACLVWSGKLDHGGYGYVSCRDEARKWRHTGSHRVAYMVEVGEIPEGLVIDHLCRNRTCYNVAHLEPVTAAENTRRGKESRTECGRGHSRAVHSYVNRHGDRKCRLCTQINNQRRKARLGR